jgi:hypothetical protein
MSDITEYGGFNVPGASDRCERSDHYEREASGVRR